MSAYESGRETAVDNIWRAHPLTLPMAVSLLNIGVRAVVQAGDLQAVG